METETCTILRSICMESYCNCTAFRCNFRIISDTSYSIINDSIIKSCPCRRGIRNCRQTISTIDTSLRWISSILMICSRSWISVSVMTATPKSIAIHAFTIVNSNPVVLPIESIFAFEMQHATASSRAQNYVFVV